ncbi:MAG: hypothetical protein K6F16_06865 [Lachnospiraceae bacterium]|nr:hypothetical protein [Lachnospiraceae bacterium]
MFGYEIRIKTKRMICLMGTVIVSLALSACSRIGNVPAAPTEAPVQKITQTAAPTAMPTIAPSPEPEMPYKGDGSKYEYIMTDERDRAWEEDIVYFADRFLDKDSGHSRLIERGCEIGDLIGSSDGAEYWITDRYESLLDVEMREEFIARINSLLLSIPEKSDYELKYECAEAAAILHDNNSFVPFYSAPENDMFFPLELKDFYTKGNPEAYIVSAPEGMENLLLCRLDAINGISFSDILERYSGLISHESMTWPQFCFFYCGSSRLQLSYEMLCYLGVLDGEKTAIFSLTDENGAVREIELSCVKDDESLAMVDYQQPTESDESISAELSRLNAGEAAQYCFLEDGKTVYIRVLYWTAETYKTATEAIWAAEKAGNVQKVILDMRGNAGGASGGADLIRHIHALETEGGKYILTDGGLRSESIFIAVCLRRAGDDVLLVGAPAGEPANGMFFESVPFSTPNKNLKPYISSHTLMNNWPGNDDPALRPDITVYQTLEDYKNGVDTVLKYILRESGD